MSLHTSGNPWTLLKAFSKSSLVKAPTSALRIVMIYGWTESAKEARKFEKYGKESRISETKCQFRLLKTAKEPVWAFHEANQQPVLVVNSKNLSKLRRAFEKGPLSNLRPYCELFAFFSSCFYIYYEAWHKQEDYVHSCCLIWNKDCIKSNQKIKKNVLFCIGRPEVVLLYRESAVNYLFWSGSFRRRSPDRRYLLGS